MQTVGWHKDNTLLRFHARGKVKIAIPSRNIAVVSYQFSRRVLRLKCVDYRSEYFYDVTLGYIRNSARHELWHSCRTSRHQTVFLVKESELFVKYNFQTLYLPETGALGFRFFFSFHKSAQLSQLPDKRWNCSVPGWADFQTHFPCNLAAECVGGEDEQDCPYTNVPRCGAGAIFLGESCYFYVISDDKVTWNDAMDKCEKHDAHLVSLNTPIEWIDIMELLAVRGRSIYLGLRSTSPHLPY